MATKRIEKKKAVKLALSESQLVGAYFDWLCSEVGGSGIGENDSYFFLMKELFEIEYIVFIGNDRNRAEDGKRLREDFKLEIRLHDEYKGVNWEAIEGPCKVLEMMVGLAKRMDFLCSAAEEQGINIAKCFWEMIENCGLDVASDSVWISDSWIEKCRIMVDDILCGRGDFGFFGDPKAVGVDSFGVKKELWYQMNDYLLSKGRY